MYFKLLIFLFLLTYFDDVTSQNQLAASNEEIKIGLTHAPPLIILNDNAPPTGMLVDFIKEVAVREDWNISWQTGSWSVVYESAKQSKLDIMTFIAYTPERTEFFEFSKESFVTGWGQVYTYDNSQFQNVLDFNNKTIAVVEDDVHVAGFVELCEKFNVTCHIKHIENYDLAFQMLENEEVEGVVCGSNVGHTYENRFNIFRTSVMYKPTDALFATSKQGRPELLKVIDEYLVKWKGDSSSPYSISKEKWMGDINRGKVPSWVYYVIFAIFSLLVISAIIVSILRNKIKSHVKEYKKQSMQLKQIVDLVPHMIYVVNSEGEVVLVNNYASDFFGVKGTLNTTTHKILEKIPQYEKLFEGDKELLTHGVGSIFKEITCKNSIDEDVTFNISKVSFASNDNAHSVLTVGVDITEELAYQKKIHYMAEHDDLTDLPNRALLKHVILENAKNSIDSEAHGAILFIDLDSFKNINDSLGHVAGDLLLKSVSERLKNIISDDDWLARIGGDEFILYLPAIYENFEEIEANATNMASTVLDELSKKFIIENQSFYISASIGIVIYPRDASNYEQSMQRADIAMYQAKSKGRNCYVVFEQGMENDILARQKIVIELHKALERSEFFIEYQPQIQINEDKLIGLEALIRWKHPSGKIVQPDGFIQIAEDCGLIIPIGNWVLEEVFKEISNWVNSDKELPFITINLSVLQLHNSELVDILMSLFRKYGVPSHLIEFEVTESVLIENIERTIYTLFQLKNLGIRLSIDDFGTGYSSLSYLKKLPFDKLKIDYSFVKDLNNNSDMKTIVKTIIGMAGDLGLDVIAEGVETRDQLDLLSTMGCKKFQGFYFDRPSSLDYIKNKYFDSSTVKSIEE